MALRKKTGTSYEAKGMENAKPEDFVDMGSAGQTIVDWEVPELSNLYGQIQMYDKMVNNDVSTDVSLRAVKVPIQNGYYYIDSFDDSEENLMISEFVSYNLNRSSVGFLNGLNDILTFFEYGFSILEKVWEMGEWAYQDGNRKQYTMLKKLAPRPATSLNKFLYDNNGSPVGIVQNAFDPKLNKVTKVTIPISKLLIFTLNRKGGALQGRSILRPAYKHWYYKDNFYKIDGIQKERHAIGIPDAQLPPGWSDKEFQIAKEIVKNLRTNESAHVVRPPDLQISFLKPEGQMVNVLESANHHDLMIMKNVYVQFMNMGVSTGGGRATASSQFDMFLKALRYVANLICEYFNQYLIPQLVQYNFDTDEFPQMKVRRLGEARDLQMFASGMANLAKQKLITVDDDTEAWIRAEIDMPRKKSNETPRNLDTPNDGSSNGKTTLGRLPTEKDPTSSGP